jgi:hypothetical protein
MIKKILRNPELIRNYWTEISALKLWMVPIFVVLILVLSFITPQNMNAKLDLIRVVAVVFFVASAFLYGGVLCSLSVYREVKNRTWNNQRLTLLTPAEMVIGKWFGPSLYAWFIALIALGVYLFGSLSRALLFESLWYALILVLLAGVIQLGSGALGLGMSRRFSLNRSGSYTPAIPLVILGIVIASSLYPALSWKQYDYTIQWWGFEIHRLSLIAGWMFLALFTAWNWYLGSMGKELLYPEKRRLYNLIFPLHLLFLLGFPDRNKDIVVSGFVFCLALNYWFALSISPSILQDFKAKDKSVFSHHPLRSSLLWTIGFLVVIVSISLSKLIYNKELWTIVSFFGLFLRDFGLYLWIVKSNKYKQPELMWIFLILLINALVAPIVGLSGLEWMQKIIFPYEGSVQVSQALLSLLIGSAILVLTARKSKDA